LCCFSTSNTKCKHIFRYRLSLETFGYTLVDCAIGIRAAVLPIHQSESFEQLVYKNRMIMR